MATAQKQGNSLRSFVPILSERGERLSEIGSGFYPLSLDAPPPTLLKKAVPEAPRASVWVPNQQNMGPQVGGIGSYTDSFVVTAIDS